MAEPPAVNRGDSLSNRKAALRERLLTARASLDTSWREQASAAIVETVRALPEATEARAVLGFAAFGTEVNVDALLQGWLDQGFAVHLPFVDGTDLGIARVTDLDADCAPGWGGVREPDPSRRVAANPADLDLAVVPGVGFDPAGRRVGYGGGHFDRLLTRLVPATPVVGVAFSTQVVAQLPVSDHDVPVDVLVTETTVHRPGR